jgi:hypothetical protein
VIPVGDLLQTLPERDRRGSRGRCILLTHGSKEDVARRLSALAGPFVIIDPNRHRWMPLGFADPREAKLGDALSFLSDEHREAITTWWLAVPQGANTPNWDIVSTATINGAEGLLLVEAKAHCRELSMGGTAAGAENAPHIIAACREATDELNSILPRWTLSTESHYQLSNRFAWAWKLASLGVPVVLVYLGFLRAEEMRDQGRPIANAKDWESLLRDHSAGKVPATMWDDLIMIDRTPLRARIRAIKLALDGTADETLTFNAGSVLWSKASGTMTVEGLKRLIAWGRDFLT